MLTAGPGYWRAGDAAKVRAHHVFDQLWRGGYMGREDAYQWLAGQMGMTRAEAHFRLFDIGLCEAAVELARAKLRELKRERNKRRRAAMRQRVA